MLSRGVGTDGCTLNEKRYITRQIEANGLESI